MRVAARRGRGADEFEKMHQKFQNLNKHIGGGWKDLEHEGLTYKQDGHWVTVSKNGEKLGQFEFLKKHGCEEAQGFLICRPLEEPELRAWWKMQDEEERIVGRQPDMWRVEGD